MLSAFTSLQLLLLLSAVNSRPHAWDGDRLQLERIKKEILERLGMAAPPIPERRLDQGSILRAQSLYQQKAAELARNRSQEEEKEGAVSRLHRLTPSCKWTWVGVGIFFFFSSSHPGTGVCGVPALGNVTSLPWGHDRACREVAALILCPGTGEESMLESFGLKKINKNKIRGVGMKDLVRGSLGGWRGLR